ALRILQVELEAPRDREHAWLAAQREQLAALARAPGGVCFRLWRELGAPGRFLWLENWQTPEDARASRQRAGGARLGQFDLLDMAWGRDADAFLRPGIHADHIRAGVGPGKWHDWRVYSRNFVSVMARQPGLVTHETLHCCEDALGFVALRTLVSRAAAR